MDGYILNSVLMLGGAGIIGAVILYIVSVKFKVFEDERIDVVETMLPGANCGACGKTGCRAFATAVVGADEKDFVNLFCPVGGNKTMANVANFMGYTATEKEPHIAVLRCNGSLANAPKKVEYDGAPSCRLAHNIHAGESGCPHGCLGLADCVSVCNFDALHMNEVTGLPEVDAEKCTACGACVKMCPRHLFELRPKGKDNKRVYVSCMNTQKGGTAKKNCKVACIGCGKCERTCADGSVKIENNLSYISASVNIDEFGGALVGCCPTGAIAGVNVEPVVPEKKVKKAETVE